jgi:hypothetical protein
MGLRSWRAIAEGVPGGLPAGILLAGPASHTLLYFMPRQGRVGLRRSLRNKWTPEMPSESDQSAPQRAKQQSSKTIP